MSELVTNCPRCGAVKITFDLMGFHLLKKEHGWLSWFEAQYVCRECSQSTVFLLSLRGIDYKNSTPGSIEKPVNHVFKVENYLSLKNFVKSKPPEHVPPNIKTAFEEGASCMAIECFNAGATMFRLCIDHSTKVLLPREDENGLTPRIRRSLGLRLKWLFDNGKLPEALRELSHCIKEDGNDGAHDGTLRKEDAEDVVDFTFVLLERLYTEPERLRLAQARRHARRQQ
jgi:hypothetical protein